MHHFVEQNNLIHNFPAFRNTNLFQGDDEKKQWPKTVGHDLGDNFVDDITQSNRSKFPWVLYSILFGDEH